MTDNGQIDTCQTQEHVKAVFLGRTRESLWFHLITYLGSYIYSSSSH